MEDNLIPDFLRIIAVSLTTLVLGFSQPATADDAAPVIKNFKFGLVCGQPSNRRVCFETNDIQITNESRCVYNQKPIACTWFGYSFDYDAPADLKMHCAVHTDQAYDSGNPKGIVQRAATDFQYDLDLVEGNHHFFLSNYISGEKTEKSPSKSSLRCNYGDISILSADYSYEFTVSTPPIETVPNMNVAR